MLPLRPTGQVTQQYKQSPPRLLQPQLNQQPHLNDTAGSASAKTPVIDELAHRVQ